MNQISITLQNAIRALDKAEELLMDADGLLKTAAGIQTAAARERPTQTATAQVRRTISAARNAQAALQDIAIAKGRLMSADLLQQGVDLGGNDE